MTPRIRTLRQTIRIPLVASFLLTVLAFSTPALARPTTPCDEQPQGCHGARPGENEARDEGGVGHPDNVIEKRRQDEEDDGGSDIGGL